MARFDGENKLSQHQPVRLAERYAYSDKFGELFSEGMQLVDESSSFLDGPGRKILRNLDYKASLLYGTESIRLTTRLMQLASWLLLQRAANEGEMSHRQILEEKEKISLEKLSMNRVNFNQHDLPQKFTSLIDRSLKLQKRIIRLDAELYGPRMDEGSSGVNPVNEQIGLLATAFGTGNRAYH